MNKTTWEKGDRLRVTLEFTAQGTSGNVVGDFMFSAIPGRNLERDLPHPFNSYAFNMSETMRMRNGSIEIEKIASKPEFEFPKNAGSVVKAGNVYFMLDEYGEWGNLDGQWSQADIRNMATEYDTEVEIIHE